MLKILFIILSLSSFVFAGTCDNLNKVPICHAGSEKNPNYVDICVDLAAIGGHFGQHSLDKWGYCKIEDSVPYLCDAGIRHLPDDKDFSAFDFIKFAASLYSDEPSLEKLAIHSAPNRFALASDLFPGTLKGDLILAGAIADEDDLTLTPSELSFNLGSEKYGTDYFVDICWRNPSEDKKLNLEFYTDISIPNAFSPAHGDYLQKAKIENSAALFCDFGEGVNLNRANEESALTPFSGNLKTYSFNGISGASFCVLRHYLQENAREARAWQFASVKVMSSMSVKGPEIPSIPILFCHVQKTGPKDFSCETKFFPSEVELVAYINTEGGEHPYRQKHNLDYRGVCLPGPCHPL